jgi:CRP/FNR family transcriptional regulator, cyclic AMP receptor protein
VFASEVASLQRIPMFRDVDVTKLKLIALAGRRVHYRPGDTILQQGDPAQMVFVIMEGSASVMREVDGNKVHLADVGAGSLVGEVGVVLDQPYSGTIVATNELTALQIDQTTFLELLRQVPQLSLALIRELSRRLLATSELYARAVS